ncbi:MAG: glycerol-3-phosphate 1-O-acyltransferase PlsY [Proteobacteria bacterium]|nr:glycerol-3-phosphate 1-O-acyltransferase PlsY [Pseudomonadota bacterium]
MNVSAVAAVLVVASYLLGSVPTGLLVARARGIDIRGVGSGNIGATNVARSLGKKLGLVVLVLDALKGATPVLLAISLGFDQPAEEIADRWVEYSASLAPWVIPAVGVAAIAGHCFPPWLRFRGGKGVATSWGVFLAVDPMMAAIATVIFAALYAAFRLASIASLSGALAMPTLLWLGGRDDPVVALGIVCAAIIAAKHSSNIGRLLRREEHKV